MRNRLIVDFLLLGNLFYLMAYPFTAKPMHKLAGVIFFVLLIIHHVINVRWAKGLSRGRWTRKRIMETFVNGALAVVALLLFYSSLYFLVKRYHLPIPIPGTRELSKAIHMCTAYGGFLLMSIHVGLHGDYFISFFKKRISQSPKALSLINGLLWLLACYGLYAFYAQHFTDYLFLRTHFVDADRSRPVIFFLFDYLAVMAMAAKLAWMGRK